jgi:predicted outer membrane protein
VRASGTGRWRLRLYVTDRRPVRKISAPASHPRKYPNDTATDYSGRACGHGGNIIAGADPGWQDAWRARCPGPGVCPAEPDGVFPVARHQRIATQKAQTDDLKEFAHLEESEQETLADVLKSLPAQHASRNEPTVRPPGDAELEQHLDQRGRQMLEKLRAEAAGAEFDRDYMGALATGHLELLRIQEAYLDSGQNNANLTNMAKLARTMIKEHLQLLTDIESGMETASSATIGAAPGKDR